MSFRVHALRDKRYKKHHRMLREGVYSLDLEHMRTELESMHALRKVRSLNLAETKNAQKMLVEAAEQNCAYRSRAVEIMMTIHRVSSQLEVLIEALGNYLSSEYTACLLSDYSTKGERKMAVDALLAPFSKKLKSCASVKETADLLVSDIDAASWTLQRLIAILELNATVERRL